MRIAEMAGANTIRVWSIAVIGVISATEVWLLDARQREAASTAASPFYTKRSRLRVFAAIIE
jgi:hypothetical protein